MIPVSKCFQHMGQKKIQNIIWNISVNAELNKSDPEFSSKMRISEYKISVYAIYTVDLKDLHVFLSTIDKLIDILQVHQYFTCVVVRFPTRSEFLNPTT